MLEGLEDRAKSAGSAYNQWRSESEAYKAEFSRTNSEIETRPLLVVTRDLAVTWRCERSEDLLDSPLPLRLKGGELMVADELGPGRFQQFLTTVENTPRRFLVRGRDTPHWAMVTAWRNAAVSPDIFMVCSPSRPLCEVETSGIAEDMGLTKAETTVLGQFAMLKTPKEIAQDLGVSLSTVRSHLKQIYAKSAVQTAVQLHRLVHTYCSW